MVSSLLIFSVSGSSGAHVRRARPEDRVPQNRHRSERASLREGPIVHAGIFRGLPCNPIDIGPVNPDVAQNLIAEIVQHPNHHLLPPVHLGIAIGVRDHVADGSHGLVDGFPNIRKRLIVNGCSNVNDGALAASMAIDFRDTVVVIDL